MQLGQIRAADAQNDTGSLGDLVHGCEVVLVGTVQNGLVVLDRFDSSLGRLNVLRVDDDGAVSQSGCLLAQLNELCAVAGVVNEHALDHFALADTLVIDLVDEGDPLFDRCVVHSGIQRGCEQVAVDEGLLVTHHDGLAAELMRADLDGLHGRRGSLGQEGDGLFGHVRALGDGNSTLCNLHAECHTGGAAAFLTVFLRR